MSILAAFPVIADRVTAIVRRTIGAVVRLVRQGSGTRLVSRPLLAPTADVDGFGLKDRCDRILVLMARIHAGAVPRQRLGGAWAVRARKRPRVRRMAAAQRRESGWLIVAAPEVRPHGASVLALLEEPGIRAMCLVAPQMGRMFAPLLHALGERMPAWMPRAHPRRCDVAFVADTVRIDGAQCLDIPGSAVSPFCPAALSHRRDEGRQSSRVPVGRWYVAHPDSNQPLSGGHICGSVPIGIEVSRRSWSRKNV